jgi:repressor LexA
MINPLMSPYHAANHAAHHGGAGADIVPLRPRIGTGTLEMQALGDDLCDVPILGRVAAGQPILAVEQAEDTVKVDRMLIGNHREVFGLRIVGESMIEDGILDGDYVFVKKTPSASPGEIVVAMIDGEATVKRYFPEGDHIRFQPANQNMSPIIVRRADFKSVDIIGIVVGVYRKL